MRKPANWKRMTRQQRSAWNRRISQEPVPLQSQSTSPPLGSRDQGRPRQQVQWRRQGGPASQRPGAVSRFQLRHPGPSCFPCRPAGHTPGSEPQAQIRRPVRPQVPRAWRSRGRRLVLRRDHHRAAAGVQAPWRCRVLRQAPSPEVRHADRMNGRAAGMIRKPSSTAAVGACCGRPVGRAIILAATPSPIPVPTTGAP